VESERVIREKLRQLIRQNLVIDEAEARFTDNDNLFAKGYVNSLFAMKLLTFVESEFVIQVEEADMDLANFSSIDVIVALVLRKAEVGS
jgi:methoxymalonate biosynthesis acyl carrier protein